MSNAKEEYTTPDKPIAKQMVIDNAYLLFGRRGRLSTEYAEQPTIRNCFLNGVRTPLPKWTQRKKLHRVGDYVMAWRACRSVWHWTLMQDKYSSAPQPLVEAHVKAGSIGSISLDGVDGWGL